MKIKKLSLILFSILFSSFYMVAQTKSKIQKSAIAIDDLQNIVGKWKGTLTYMDYSSANPYSMPCELEIESKKKNQKFNLSYNYSNEPKANSKSKLKISKDRLTLNGKAIISRTQLPDGNIQLVTEYSGKDGNDKKNALIRSIYIIGSEKLIIKKEVQFEGTKDWLTRNEYNFNKA